MKCMLWEALSDSPQVKWDNFLMLWVGFLQYCIIYSLFDRTVIPTAVVDDVLVVNVFGVGGLIIFPRTASKSKQT